MKMHNLFVLQIGLVGLLLYQPSTLRASHVPGDSTNWFSIWMEHTEPVFQTLYSKYEKTHAEHRDRLASLNTLLKTPRARIPEYGYTLLLEKIQLEENLRFFEGEAALNLVRLRYRKGIELLKMLYEKILSLDHHFTSLRTNQQVARISNPNAYPEFKEAKILLESRMKKKFGFALPALMESNPYLSAMYSIIGLTLGGGNTKAEEDKFNRITCILDFTVRMDQQLQIIYYETEYLRDANLSLKKECEALFSDCTRPISYTLPLNSCREFDDWEQLYNRLDQYVEPIIKSGDPNASQWKKAQTHLQFSVDRIVHFLEKYCAFIAQGNAFYKKFAKIAGSYVHEDQCSEILPEMFSSLKEDIEITLEKFNSAYNLPELQGSRLKDLLYGIGD